MQLFEAKSQESKKGVVGGCWHGKPKANNTPLTTPPFALHLLARFNPFSFWLGKGCQQVCLQPWFDFALKKTVVKGNYLFPVGHKPLLYP